MWAGLAIAQHAACCGDACSVLDARVVTSGAATTLLAPGRLQQPEERAAGCACMHAWHTSCSAHHLRKQAGVTGPLAGFLVAQ
jgi:hypothetical protein